MKYLLSLVIVASLILVGCAEQDVRPGTDPFIGGTQGLSMEFLSQTPPDQIFDNRDSSFTVAVRLENRGEFDVSRGAGFLQIVGISPSEFGVTAAQLRQPVPALDGMRKTLAGTIQPGHIDVVTFPDLMYQENLAGDLLIENFRVRACYDYETRSSTQICIKEGNIDGLKENEICIVNERKRTSNSGAPIKIQNLVQTSRGSTGIQVSFDVVHVGDSRNKWFPKGDTVCDERVGNSDLYKVFVEVEPIVNNRYRAQCSGGTFNGGNRGEVVLHGGEPRKVICSFDLDEADAEFEARLNVNVEYRYMQYIEKSILVKDRGN